MTRRQICLTAVLLALSVALTACSQSSVTLTLDLIVTAADAAVGVMQSTGQIPPGTATMITNYLGDLTTAVDFATTELASSDTAAVKAAKIAQEFAMIAAPNLPPGTASAIVSTIQAVAKAVANFLASVQTAALNIQAVPAGANAFAGKSGTLKLNSADMKALPKIKARNAVVKAKLAALPKK